MYHIPRDLEKRKAVGETPQLCRFFFIMRWEEMACLKL